MRRAAGPLTQRDRDAIVHFEATLRESFRIAERMVIGVRDAMTPAVTEGMRQIGRAAAMVAAYEALPRHRAVPARDEVIDWLDRHAGPPGYLVEQCDEELVPLLTSYGEQARAIAHEGRRRPVPLTPYRPGGAMWLSWAQHRTGGI